MGGKAEAPPAPDYRGAAQEQADASKENTQYQTWANRPNQYTPWGSSEWNANRSIDPSTGKPITQWDQTISLDPAAQAALDDQQSITSGRSAIAQGMLGDANTEMKTPENFWNTLPDVAGSPNVPDYYGQNLPGMGQGADPMGGGQDYAKVAYDRQMSLQGPQMEREVEQMNTRLRNQGLSPGTPAFDNAINDLRNQQGERQARMGQDAVFQGGGMQDAMFNRQMQSSQYADQQRQQAGQEQLAFGQQGFNQQVTQSNLQNQIRQQAIAEQMQREGWSLNKINAMLSGQQVANPNMPNFSQASKSESPQYLNAAQSAGDYGLAGAKLEADQQAAFMNAVGSAAGGFAMMSDERVKTDIVKIAKIGPLDLVKWTWTSAAEMAGDAIGFLAQDVLKLYPQHVHPVGEYIGIDYVGLLNEMEAA